MSSRFATVSTIIQMEPLTQAQAKAQKERKESGTIACDLKTRADV